MQRRPEVRATAHPIPHRVYSEPVHSRTDPVPPLELLLQLHGWIYTARAIDDLETELVARGEAYFQLASSGHEANASLAPWLEPTDWLAPHYRAKALFLARGMAIESFFHNLLNTELSQSAGRQMNPFASDRALRILPQTIPVGNTVLHAVGVAQELKRARDPRALVVAGFGDGGAQQGETLESVCEAVRTSAPVLFVIEDNAYAISTRTRGRTFYSLPDWASPAKDFLGLAITHIDGRDPVAALEPFRQAVTAVRLERRPRLVVLDVERLANHTNADDERVYRTAEERDTARCNGDPLRSIRQAILARGVKEGELDAIEQEKSAAVAAAAERARLTPDPPATLPSEIPTSTRTPARPRAKTHEPRRLTLLEAIREVLRARLAADPRVHLVGQDIEDPKGDVFGLTRGLSTEFPGRVQNAALAEATIVGTSIGSAMAGGRPVAFLQFADFLPVAYNQIHSELGSLAWRTAGEWRAPVILLAAAGGYRPGLGPFHSQTFESVLAHTPGLNVLFPSTASDAAGLLQAAFDAEEPTILLYPKIALNDPERVGVFDPTSHREAFGTARHVRRGDRLTIVSYGSTMPVVEHAAEWLEQSGASCDLFDLRSLAPWDRRAVIDSARRTGKLLVVHEDNRTCGLGAEIAATAAESAPGIQILRITRDDTYIPCNVTRHLDCLPSLRSVLDAAARLVGIRIQWVDPAVVRSENSSPGSASARLFDVEARGSSPADHTITVVTWLVELGQDIRAGQPIAELEAEKALFTLASPASGVVEELVIREGQAVPAGTVLARLRATDTPARALRSSSMEALPRLIESAASRPNQRLKTQVSIPAHPSSLVRVPTLLAIAAARGAQRVDNESLLPRFATRTASEIEKRTGIRARRQLAEGESLLDLAEEAATSALVQAGLRVHDLHALVLSTTTPPSITPSLACLLLERLGAREKEKPAPELPAHDLFAACTGYLYALAHAYDLCLAQPDARILVVTAEAMSRTVNPDDFDTSILFGDAATATLVAGPEAVAKSNDATPGGTSPSLAHRIRLHRPLVSARGEPGKIIHVPVPGQGHFRMDGLRVFAEAVKRMAGSLDQVCAQNAITPAELSLVIPHQANAKIIEEVRAKVGLPPERIASEIAEIGNSSSSSIPVVLADRLAQKALPRGWIGLTAFGGGFTFGSGLLEVE